MQCSMDGRHPSLLPSPDFLQRLENCSNEILDRRLRQTELAADLLVALSLYHELQHIELLLGQAEALADNLILDALALIARTKPRPFHGGDVDEPAFARSLGLNKSVALCRVEPFDRASRHHRLLASNQLDRHRTTGVRSAPYHIGRSLCGTTKRGSCLPHGMRGAVGAVVFVHPGCSSTRARALLP